MGIKKYGLSREMVDPKFREPFIVKGYRKPNMNALDCFKSAFAYYCNETFNVWSHFLAFLLFFIKFWNLYRTEISLEDRYYWPLLCYSIGILGFCLMSSIAHMFNSISHVIRNVCFFLDYAAISIYSVGAGQAFYFYARPVDDKILTFQSPRGFAMVSLLISTLSTVLCCLTRYKWHSVKYILRSLSFVLPFIVNTFPYLYRMGFCVSEFDCDKKALPLFIKHGVLFVLAAVANCTRLPERIIPGAFDILGQSHHFMHIFTAIGCGIQFDAIKIDMQSRRNVLVQQSIQEECSYTFLVMLAAIAMNVGIVFLFGITSSERIYDSKSKKEKLQ